ncbi:hypothetical protein A8B75_13790 [Sphingomonadales bacterium EhC05]|nr:hypothetical protein A8B75_13790 [Sphingomonadales bacterium EhC05]
MSDLHLTPVASDDDVVPLWRTTPEQRQFSSWTGGLDAHGSDGGGASSAGFSVKRPSDNVVPSADQNADIFDVAYKKGWEDGQSALAEEHLEAKQVGDNLALAIQQLNSLSSSGSFEFILSAVESLFRRCAELAIPDSDLLQAWAMQLAELVDQDQKGVTLILHPDDVGLIDANICKLRLRGDESLLRGNLKLSHSGGWVEKGSSVVLEELRALIDEFHDHTAEAGHD